MLHSGASKTFISLTIARIQMDFQWLLFGSLGEHQTNCGNDEQWEREGLQICLQIGNGEPLQESFSAASYPAMFPKHQSRRV